MWLQGSPEEVGHSREATEGGGIGILKEALWTGSRCQSGPSRSRPSRPRMPCDSATLTDTTLELSWSKSCRWWKELERAEESWGKTK